MRRGASLGELDEGSNCCVRKVAQKTTLPLVAETEGRPSVEHLLHCRIGHSADQIDDWRAEFPQRVEHPLTFSQIIPAPCGYNANHWMAIGCREGGGIYG